MPGIEAGRDHDAKTACQCVAPSAYAPGGSSPGPPGSPPLLATITVGRTSTVRMSAPARRTLPRPMPPNEEGEPQDAVDDRGDRREVLDVDLEQPVVPALAIRVLLEVEGRADADRHDH